MAAASARYTVHCPTCAAEPGSPCRTLTTGRVTDAHNYRIWRQHVVEVVSTAASTATTPTPAADESRD